MRGQAPTRYRARPVDSEIGVRYADPVRIIYLDIDCLRPDHLGCYGYNRPTSPAIDSIAADGMRFNRYYCQSSPCLPSRTALASGRFGIRNGVVSNVGAGAEFHLKTRDYGGPAPENEMFPRLLRAAGYDTYCFSNFADRHNALWFMYGWSEFHTPNLKGGAETAEEVTDCLFPWLRRNAQRDNYFLHINFWDTHRCYKMDEIWADRFGGYPVTQSWPDEDAIGAHQQITGPFTANGQFSDHRSPYPLMPGAVRSRADFEQMITGYDAAIAYVDYHVSNITDVLSEAGVLEDTAIIISSDHGDAFGEHGIYSDHVCADECIHRVPLIVKWPGIANRGSSEALLYNVDLPATVCDILGIERPADWDGTSFKNQVEGTEGGGHEYLVWDHGLYTVQRAVRTRQHLLINTFDDYGYNFAKTELYDIAKDPYQTNNIALAVPETAAVLGEMLTDWEDKQLSGSTIADPLRKILAARAAVDS